MTNRWPGWLCLTCCVWTFSVVRPPTATAADEERTTDGRTVEELLQALADADDKTRRLAGYEWGKRRPDRPEHVQVLLKTANDVEPEVRRGAIWSLGQVAAHHDQAVAALLTALAEDPRPKNRVEAIHALGELGPAAEDAIPALESVARGGRGTIDVAPFQPTRTVAPLKANALIRSDAIQALGKIGSERAIDVLLVLLAKAERDSIVYSMPYYILCSEALGRIGKADPRVLAALGRAKRLRGGQEFEKIRLAADSALREIEKAGQAQDP